MARCSARAGRSRARRVEESTSSFVDDDRGVLWLSRAGSRGIVRQQRCQELEVRENSAMKSCSITLFKRDVLAELVRLVLDWRSRPGPSLITQQLVLSGVVAI